MLSRPGTALEAHFAKLTPMERWGRPQEIASVVCFLLSDAAAFVNGVDLLVDGGMCQSEPPGAYFSHRLGALLKANI